MLDIDFNNPISCANKYIELEREFNKLGESLKRTKSHRRGVILRNKRKKIRAEQNLLYPTLAKYSYVRYTQSEIGLKDNNQTLYKRYLRGTGKE